MRCLLALGLLVPLSWARPKTCSEHIEASSELPHNVEPPPTLQLMLEAMGVMQSSYFELWTGTWPTAIDWTAAVLGTHISATLSTLVAPIDRLEIPCSLALRSENVVNKYFAHTSAFYFGENAFGLRNQAYDDMLWVVLGWLENIKFQNVHSDDWQIVSPTSSSVRLDRSRSLWHGAQFSPAAAHRSRIFYEIASHGWDTSLCSGGMVWNPHLKPYKNAITNELFISASIAMYLYFPGDDIDSPFLSSTAANATNPFNPTYLTSAIEAYSWLKSSGMTNIRGLYQDGFHITGWQRTPNGTHPGTGQCDELNTMIYTYNQGVVLSGLRGLFLATAATSYLDDGHSLIRSVIVATGWQHPRTGIWHGLGRNGILEETCDHKGDCSQNGHTFKGIFFHHMAEFCRPLWRFEREFLTTGMASAWERHLAECATYEEWVRHNAAAALMTRDEDGKFGMWWGQPYGKPTQDTILEDAPLPVGAVDYRNHPDAASGGVYHEDLRADLKRDAAAQQPLNKQKQQTSHASFSDSDGGGRFGPFDVNDRGRGRTVETQSGGLAVLRALWQWESMSQLRARDAAEDRDEERDRERWREDL
ncbi:MAG: hypothetical protein Q9160_006192 [Pyrenula sp. 1 TL-2023]